MISLLEISLSEKVPFIALYKCYNAVEMHSQHYIAGNGLALLQRGRTQGSGLGGVDPADASPIIKV